MPAIVKKSLIVVIMAVAIAAWFIFDLHRWISFEQLQAQQDWLQSLYESHTVLFLSGFFLLYVIVTALSLPAAGVLTVAAGFLFGLLVGTVLVSFASSIGATLAFLVSRYLFRDTLERKYGQRIRKLDEGVRKEGAFYLFTLRLIPVIPYWLINIGMGLTGMKAWTFYWVSQVGMLLGTLVYVYAGTELAELSSPGDILSPGLIAAFVLIGITPLVSKRIVDVVKRRKTVGKYHAPAETDYNIVVIGAGSGGLVASYIGAAVNAKVALVEKGKMGGDCLNTGCVPSKSLIRSAKILQYIRRHQEFGIKEAHADWNLADIMDRVHRVIGQVAPHDSRERYGKLGVDCIAGEARIVDPYTIEIGERRITTRNIVIATGARPLVPPIDGIDEVQPITSENLWQLRELPKRLVVVGGGPIGSEMTQAFRRLGAEVTQIESGERILEKEDPDISDLVAKRFEEEGIAVRTNERVVRFERAGDDKVVVTEDMDGQEQRIACDEVLMALGRKANVQGFGLEELGVQVSDKGTLDIDDFVRTNFPNIFAVGDVAGPLQFTHFAAHQAWYAAVNALFAPFKRFKADYSVIPWCTFTDPEVAHVGHNEQSAEAADIAYEVTTYGIDDLDRAMAESEAYGTVKVLTAPGSDSILGVTIVGSHAGDLLAEYVLAMKQNVGLNTILGTIHTYPTMAEANKYAAGAWKQAHKPEGVLRFLRRYHGWRRSRRGSILLFGGLGAAGALLLGAAWLAWALLMPASAPDQGPKPRVDAAQPPASVATDLQGTPVFTGVAADSYSTLLNAVVDDAGLVDYAAVTSDRWRSHLDVYLRTLAHLDPAVYGAWDRPRRIAFWINAYNALMLGLVAEQHPIGRTPFGLMQDWFVTDIPVDSVRNIPWPFSGVSFTVMGMSMTLDRIEKQVLIDRLQEPLAHMAVNCASMGCPPMRAEAYHGEQLESQLADQADRFVNQHPPTRVRIDRETGTVELSSILQWYADDFVPAYAPQGGYLSGADEGEQAVLHFCAQYLPAADASYLREDSYTVTYRPYDWHLNAQSGD